MRTLIILGAQITLDHVRNGKTPTGHSLIGPDRHPVLNLIKLSDTVG